MSQFIEMTGDPRTNPKGWTVKKLPELASYSIGLTYKPEQVSESGTIVLRSGNIQSYKIDLTDVVRVDCPIKESIYVQKDDILMCSRNGSVALVGKVAQIKEIHEPMTYGAFMTVIRSEYSDFLYLYFQSKDFREQVSTGKSSTMNQITQNMLDKISIPLPDGDTRKKLSDILHQADKSKFGDFKSQFIEMFGNPFEINSEMVPLSSLCSINPFKPKGLDDSLSVSFIPMDRISEDGEYAEFETKPLKDVKKGFTYCAEDDVLFAKITPCMENGKGAILKGLSNGIGFGSTEFHVLRPIWGISNSEWLYFLTKLNGFRIDAAKNMIGTGGQKRVPSSYLLNFKVLKPQLEAQKEFAKIVHQADKSKSVIQKALVYLNDIQSDELGKIA